METLITLRILEIYQVTPNWFAKHYKKQKEPQMPKLLKYEEYLANGSLSRDELRKIILARKNMIDRCYNEKADSYPHYGGRGITVCKQWRDDKHSFIEWSMENGHGLDLSLDRINVNGSYEPTNCRWADEVVQHNNRRDNVLIEHNGVVKTIGEWCSLLKFTAREKNTAYKRRLAHGATTYGELFCKNLASYRTKTRVDKCLVCERSESVKWRKNGKLCNTCYHRALRWSKKTGEEISCFPEWLDIEGYSKLVRDEINNRG